jgi:hypothetical protein
MRRTLKNIHRCQHLPSPLAPPTVARAWLGKAWTMRRRRGLPSCPRPKESSWDGALGQGHDCRRHGVAALRQRGGRRSDLFQADRWWKAWRHPPLQRWPSGLCGFARWAAGESRASIMSESTIAWSSGVVTLLKVTWLRIFHLLLDVLGETLDPGLPGRTMAVLSVTLTLWGHPFGTRDAWRGLMVERCFVYHIISGGSWQRYAVGSRWRACEDGYAQGVGTV